MTRMNDEDERKRECIENVLTLSGRYKVIHPVMILRVEQAIKRSGLDDLLLPVKEYLKAVNGSFESIQKEIVKLEK